MNKTRRFPAPWVVGLVVAGAAVLSGCVAVPTESGYGQAVYSEPYYNGVAAPVYVAPPSVYIEGGSYYQGPGYGYRQPYGNPFYDLPRSGYAPGYPPGYPPGYAPGYRPGNDSGPGYRPRRDDGQRPGYGPDRGPRQDDRRTDGPRAGVPPGAGQPPGAGARPPGGPPPNQQPPRPIAPPQVAAPPRPLPFLRSEPLSGDRP